MLAWPAFGSLGSWGAQGGDQMPPLQRSLPDHCRRDNLVECFLYPFACQHLGNVGPGLVEEVVVVAIIAHDKKGLVKGRSVL